MKLLGALAICLTFSMLAADAAIAQQPSPEHTGGPQQAPTSAPHEMHGMQHMEMCRQMTGPPGMMGGGMMGGGMMGMPMMMGGDPKQQAEMLAMRGEMMKAMGDIMMKYAQRMQSGK